MRIWTKKIVHVETLSDLVGFRRLAAPSFDRQVDHPRYLHGDMGRKVLCSIDFNTNGDLRDAEVYGEIYGAKIIDVHSLLAMCGLQLTVSPEPAIPRNLGICILFAYSNSQISEFTNRVRS